MEELAKLSMDEFVNLIPARQRRSLRKGLPKRQQKLLQNLRRAKKALRKSRKVIVVKTHNRDMIVTPEMVGLTVGVHNGKEFIEFVITPEHIGHYFGEYAPTNKKVSHGNPGIGASRGSMYVPLK